MRLVLYDWEICIQVVEFMRMHDITLGITLKEPFYLVL
jgi:hypothetical protein